MLHLHRKSAYWYHGFSVFNFGSTTTVRILCNQAHGRDNKASKTTSRTMLKRAPNTQHAAQRTACCWIYLSHETISRLPLLTNSTLLLPTFQSPLYIDFGLLRRTSSYFRDLTLIVTRVTLTSIRHL